MGASWGGVGRLDQLNLSPWEECSSVNGGGLGWVIPRLLDGVIKYWRKGTEAAELSSVSLVVHSSASCDSQCQLSPMLVECSTVGRDECAVWACH